LLAIFIVQLGLPLRCKAVKRNVHDEKDETEQLRFRAFIRRLAQERKNGNASRNEQRFEILRLWIRGALQEFAHDHDGDDFRRLEDGLDGKRNVLERRVLRPRTHRIGQRARCKGKERGMIIGKHGAVLDFDHDHGDNDGQEAIGKDTKSGARKFAIGHARCRFKDGRHDELLHVSPCQVRSLQSAKAHDEFDRLLVKFGIAVAVLCKKQVERILRVTTTMAVFGQERRRVEIVFAEGKFARVSLFDDKVGIIFRFEWFDRSEMEKKKKGGSIAALNE
jgi:hypothetical protein